ncbi:MAG: DNA repair protein RadC [Clostridiaceae bacterium]|jgi:DNA repair protein RadC|nr:DNA repair protein RadC [Clostridiaceae bacterium]
MTKRLKMKDLPINERPYEKLEKYGAEMLSDAELLAIIIKTGTRNETSVSLAQRILARDEEGKGIAALHDFSLEQLRSISGIGKVKAIQIKAAMELSKRVASAIGNNGKIIIRSSNDVSRLLMEDMRHLKKEVFKVLLLNTKNHLIKQMNVSVGSLNASIVHPREVFSEAVKTGCSSVIFVHNHPSGDPEPSKEDIDTTRKLADAGKILGINVLDHIIIGNGIYVSLKEKGII